MIPRRLTRLFVQPSLLLLPGLLVAQTPQWRIDANARIEQHRKGDLTVVARDPEGNPISGASVQVEMQSHAFRFGTAVGAGIFAKKQRGETLSDSDQQQHDKILQYFNTVTFGNDLKWRFENANTATLVTDALDYADSRNIAVRGHTMIWPHSDKAGAVNHYYALPDGSFSNSDIVDQWNAAGQTDSAAFAAWIQQSVQERIARMGTTYTGRLIHWDVLNEPNNFNRSGVKIWLERRWSNEGIGFINPSNGNYRPNSAGVITLADIRAEWLRLAVTEYDYVPGTGLGEAEEAEQLENLLVTFFSHPQADAFVMWGIWDGNHWRGNSPMFDADWNLKAPGQTFVDLVFNDWWTNESGQTAANGELSTRAFLGEHKDPAAQVASPVVFSKAGGSAHELLVPNLRDGLSYDIETSTTLLPGSWSLHSTLSGTTNGTTTPVSIPHSLAGDDGRLFVRIGVRE